MLRLIIYSAAVLFFISSQLLGKTKPISGRVKSDSDIYLLNVQIESLPSKTTTKSDENGRFFLRYLKKQGNDGYYLEEWKKDFESFAKKADELNINYDLNLQ